MVIISGRKLVEFTGCTLEEYLRMKDPKKYHYNYCPTGKEIVNLLQNIQINNFPEQTVCIHGGEYRSGQIWLNFKLNVGEDAYLFVGKLPAENKEVLLYLGGASKLPLGKIILKEKGYQSIGSIYLAVQIFPPQKDFFKI